MPQFNYKQLTKKLKKKGFYFLRQGKGAHEVWKNDAGQRVIISNHGSQELAIGTVNDIIKKAGFKNITDFQNF